MEVIGSEESLHEIQNELRCTGPLKYYYGVLIRTESGVLMCSKLIGIYDAAREMTVKRVDDEIKHQYGPNARTGLRQAAIGRVLSVMERPERYRLRRSTVCSFNIDNAGERLAEAYHSLFVYWKRCTRSYYYQENRRNERYSHISLRLVYKQNKMFC